MILGIIAQRRGGAVPGGGSSSDVGSEVSSGGPDPVDPDAWPSVDFGFPAATVRVRLSLDPVPAVGMDLTEITHI